MTTALVVLASVGYFTLLLTSRTVTPAEHRDVVAYLPVFGASLLFWTMFFQLFTTFSLYADTRLDLDVLGVSIPPATVVAAQGFLTIVLSPLLGVLWLRRRGPALRPLTKMSFGLVALALGYAVFLLGSGTTGTANPLWMAAFGFAMFSIAESLVPPWPCRRRPPRPRRATGRRRCPCTSSRWPGVRRCRVCWPSSTRPSARCRSSPSRPGDGGPHRGTPAAEPPAVDRAHRRLTRRTTPGCSTPGVVPLTGSGDDLSAPVIVAPRHRCDAPEVLVPDPPVVAVSRRRGWPAVVLSVLLLAALAQVPLALTGGGAWPTVRFALALVAVTATWRVLVWRAGRATAEGLVWRLFSWGCFLYGVGAVSTAAVAAVPGLQPYTDVPNAVCAALTFPLAYRALVRWSRRSAGVDPDDLLNGVSAVLVVAALVGVGVALRAGDGVDSGLLGSASWREQLLVLQDACVFICSAPP